MAALIDAPPDRPSAVDGPRLARGVQLLEAVVAAAGRPIPPRVEILAAWIRAGSPDTPGE